MKYARVCETSGCEQPYMDCVKNHRAMRKYFNESHRKYSEACQKEVEEMSKHPLSHEQFRAQIKRNREESERRRKESEEF